MAEITLKAARVNAGYRLKDAAGTMGVTEGTLIRWEKNKTYPNAQQLKMMCKLYGVKMDDIFLPVELH